jgi:hypothetical protein
LFDLPSTVDRVNSSSTTHDNTILGVLLFFLCKKFGVVDRIWQKEEYDDAPKTGYYAENLIMSVI